MNLSKRKFGIPLLFLWSLAHGIWIGAAWHNQSRSPLVPAEFSAICACGHNGLETGTAPAISAPASTDCAVCKLGAVTTELPAAGMQISYAPIEATPAPVPLHSACLSTLRDLPKSRGPPLA